MVSTTLVASFFITLPIISHSTCPFLLEGTPATSNATIPDANLYNEELSSLDIKAVFGDIYDVLRESQECWPADSFGSDSSYGPLFIRLTWHCAGTYRDTDKIGGCGGGRQRFEPEASLPDNTNLDKAKALLYPIKEKYGDSLSWGDLLTFAGTAAIIDMDGPVTEVCAGRIDSSDGTESMPLIDNTTCPEPGNCQEPLGQSTIGLIYVNPEGVMGIPDPSLSAERIREIFGRMGMDDTETVALIGGGHAFGKCHGACPAGPGASPHEDPLNPWPGNCGTGMGEDTYTSGLEGQWTTNPLQWDNEYFTQLIDDDYNLTLGDGDKYQWENQRNGYLMLTTDLALVDDDDYRQIVASFAADIEVLNEAFSAAWAKLTTSGGVWATNKFCISGEELISDAEESEEDSNQTGLIVGIIVGFVVVILVFIICIVAFGQKKEADETKNATKEAGATGMVPVTSASTA